MPKTEQATRRLFTCGVALWITLYYLVQNNGLAASLGAAMLGAFGTLAWDAFFPQPRARTYQWFTPLYNLLGVGVVATLLTGHALLALPMALSVGVMIGLTYLSQTPDNRSEERATGE